MTRRILLALLALVVSVLVAAVIPLGKKAAQDQQNSYVDDARAVARAAAAVAEEQLADHHPNPAMSRVLAAARRDRDTLVIMDSGRRVVASVGSLPDVRGGPVREAIREAVARGQMESCVAQGYVSVVVPVRDNSTVVGTVILSRSLAPLNADVRALWLVLGLIAAAAIAACAVIAFALARWVGRPLADLDASAQRLGAGDLAARAAVSGGPPELRRLAVSFNAMAARLETLMHGHRAMVADVSHQLRTPLAALRLRLDLLAADADPATAAELAGALDEFARLSRLVDGLLAVARAENTVPQRVPVDVCEVIRERVAAWRPVADDRRVWLADDVGEPAIVALGAGHMEQVLDNLIANALDAISADQHITVSAQVIPVGSRRSGAFVAVQPSGGVGSGEGAWPGGVPRPCGVPRPTAGAAVQPGAGDAVRVVVADDGPGMSADDRARAFGRFTSASPGGTGLGLAIVQRLVTSNGGTAALEETPGGGLSVILDFPLDSDGQMAHPDRTQTSAPAPGPDHDGVGGATRGGESDE